MTAHAFLGLTAIAAFVVFMLSLALAPVSVARGGDPDVSFGVRGRVLADLPPPTAMSVQHDGKLLALGDSTLIRFTRNGSIDRSFGRRGFAVASSPRRLRYAAFALQRDGKIVIAGFSREAPSAQRYRPVLLRFTRRGVLDPSFGSRGVQRAALTAPISDLRVVLVERDGKILVGGSADAPLLTGEEEAGDDFFLARFQADGAVDGGFGSGGYLQTNGRTRDLPTTLIEEPSGAILVGGISGQCLYGAGEYCDRFDCTNLLRCAAAIIRYTPDGTPNTPTASGAFGPPLAIEGYTTGPAVIRRRDGSLLVFGGRETDHQAKGILAHVSSSGSLDQRFGVARLKGSARSIEGQSAIAQPDGMILVLDSTGYLARVTPTGTPDPGFGRNGAITVPGRPYLVAVLRQPGGKIVLGGWQTNAAGSVTRLLLRRYLAR